MGEATFAKVFDQDQGFEITLPRLSDVTHLISIGARLGLTETHWRSLVTSQNVVCAKASSIVGLYVADHYALSCESNLLRELQAARSVLCNRFRLSEVNVAFGAECIVVPHWEGDELRPHLLRMLLRTVALRYRHLFRFYRKDNSLELQTIQREGWRCFQEEDETCYMMLDAAKALRGLASQLLLRFPARQDPGFSPTKIQHGMRQHASR